MSKKTKKFFKHSLSKIKTRVSIYRNTYIYRLVIVTTITIEVVALMLLYQANILRLEKEMLYWMFAATAQSMAALFAVVGMFAVFRHQNLSNILRNLYDSLKSMLKTDDFVYYIGNTDAQCWDDFILVSRAKEILKNNKERFSKTLAFNLNMDILTIISHERARNNVLKNAKVPLTAVLITFMQAIGFLMFTNNIENTLTGLVVLIVMISSITFSMISLFYYLIRSIAVKRKYDDDSDGEVNEG